MEKITGIQWSELLPGLHIEAELLSTKTFWFHKLLQPLVLSIAVLYVTFFSCSCSSWLFLPSLFVQFWLVQSPIALDNCSAQLSSAQLSSAQTSSTQQNSAKLSSDISPVPFCPVLTCPISHWTAGILVCLRFYSKLFCPMLDWTSQNWTKRDIKLWNHKQQ